MIDTPLTLSSQIRRRLAAALTAAWLLIAVLAGWLLMDGIGTPTAGPVQAWIILILLLTGSAAGSFWILRPALRQLNGMDGFERELLIAGKSQEFDPLKPTAPGAEVLYNALNAHSRRAAEDAAKREAERAAESAREGSAKAFKFLSHLHHEGNTLLASILGYGSLVADRSLRPNDANLEEYGQVIVEQARCAAALLEDFTLATRIEGGQFAPLLRVMRISPMLTALVEEAAEQSGREILLSARVENAKAVRADAVRADALSLEKALRELLEYALKSSPPGSPVCVTLESCEHPRRARIQIQDQGARIPAEELANLFQPLARGRQGHGLSLYIADAIVRAHQGEITVQPLPGAGKALTITLPLEANTG